MNTLPADLNGAPASGRWLRRGHRWIGVTLALFLLLLAVTGIGLNHADDWRLGERQITWAWLLDAYGIAAPDPAASFVDGERRATLLGGRLYLDAVEVSAAVETLTGLASLPSVVVITTGQQAFVVTHEAELVEVINLSRMPGTIERAGRVDNRAVIAISDTLYASDTEVTAFEPLPSMPETSVAWSRPTPPPAALLAALKVQYRGQGVSVERMLADLHSGRVVGLTGPLLMDGIALLIIMLTITGLAMWLGVGRRPPAPEDLEAP